MHVKLRQTELNSWAAGCRCSLSRHSVCIHSLILLRFLSAHRDRCAPLRQESLEVALLTNSREINWCCGEQSKLSMCCSYTQINECLVSHSLRCVKLWSISNMFHETRLNIVCQSFEAEGNISLSKWDVQSKLRRREGSCRPGLCLWRAADDCPVIYIFQPSEL